MTVKERLVEYINFKKMSIRAFCRKIGVVETFVGSMRVSLQPDKLAAIQSNFPELNITWLMTGEGEMLMDSNRSICELGNQSKDK